MSFSEQPAPQPATLPEPPSVTTAAPAMTPALAGEGIRPAVVAPVEIVSRGVLWSLAAIPLGMLAAAAIWRLGFIASISSFVVAGAAMWLYTKGAGTLPRRGIAPLVGVVLVGVALSFLAIVASDIVDFYGTPEGKDLGYPSVWSMLGANLFAPEVLGSYGKDLAMFVVFAVLGVFGTFRQLVGARRG